MVPWFARALAAENKLPYIACSAVLAEAAAKEDDLGVELGSYTPELKAKALGAALSTTD